MEPEDPSKKLPQFCPPRKEAFSAIHYVRTELRRGRKRKRDGGAAAECKWAQNSAFDKRRRRMG